MTSVNPSLYKESESARETYPGIVATTVTSGKITGLSEGPRRKVTTRALLGASDSALHCGIHLTTTIRNYSRTAMP